MQFVVDINRLKDNLKEAIKDKLFNWIDIRNNFQGLGIEILEELIKIDNIGLYTDSIADAIKIRNHNKKVPILVTKIERIEQIYDLIMNNIYLAVNNMELFELIADYDINDELFLFIQINVNNYEDGISIKNYYKIKDVLKEKRFIKIEGVFALTNASKYYALDDFNSLIKKENIRCFVATDDNSYTSDGFISESIKTNAIKIYSTIIKSYKLSKNNIFVDKKIKKDCYGIKIPANNFDLDKYQTIWIEDNKCKIISYFDNVLYIISSESLKSGKRVDLTNYYNPNYINNNIVYYINGKALNK